MKHVPLAIALAVGLHLACARPAEPPLAAAPEPQLAPSAPTDTSWTPAHDAAFAALLAEAGMRFNLPAGFHLTHGADNPALPYEAALADDGGRLEVRLSLRPISKVELAFDDPHSSAPEPNHLFAMMFRAVVEQLSPSGIGLESELTPQALEPYGASWGAVVVLDLRPEVAGGINQGILLALHLEDAADAYALFLPKNLKADRDRVDAALRCIGYGPSPTSQVPL